MLALVASALVGAWAGRAAGEPSAPGGAPRVTVIGDSVAGALGWMGEARAVLARGLELDLEIATCRKLAEPGCVYQGRRPSSALDVVRTRQEPLGRVVVVNVGYNDPLEGFAADVDRVLAALVARGVQRVVWVTLREARPNYRPMNDVLVQASRRWPQLQVADWDAHAAGHPEWFGDGVHMTIEGGVAFARFLRPIVLDACGEECAPGGGLLAVATAKLRGARAGVPFRARLAASGGTPPYRFSVEGLPRPLRLTTDGLVSGRPRSSGRFRLLVHVTDARGVENDGVTLLPVAPAG